MKVYKINLETVLFFSKSINDLLGALTKNFSHTKQVLLRKFVMKIFFQ